MKKLIYRQFEQIVKKYPDAIALNDAGKNYTYRELNEKANQIADYLSTLEIKDQTIMVAIPSGIQMVSSLLGIFKAGAVYLPVDLSFAKKQLAFILEETPGAPLLISESQTAQWQSLAEHLPLQQRAVHLISESNGLRSFQNTGWTSWKDLKDLNPETGQRPDANSYIFYTSGSTGNPKAILGVHQSLSQFIEWEAKEFQVAPGMRISQLTQFTFDASLRDIFLPLATGATLCIPPQAVRFNAHELVQWISRQKVHLIHTVPSLFRQLTKSVDQLSLQKPLPDLKHILLSGEPLYAKHLHHWKNTGAEHVEIVNLYGTTETTMIKTFHRIREVPEPSGQILHVGQPIDQAFILILNQGRLCRIGEIGEVYIKTPYMTRGYLHKPELTESVFVQNPLIQDREDIIYKTGDLGRYLPDRSLEILGRKDRQVKINGVRIELNEIDQAVMEISGVEETIVKTLKDVEGNPQIICYYKGKKEISEIREILQEKLNSHTLPSYFVFMKTFPLNANGKIDKRSLPTPEEALLGKDFDPPKAGIETQIANTWKRELHLKKVGRNHSFYQLGGNSLKAMKIAGDLQLELGIELKLTDILVYPTIARLADFLERTKPSKRPTAISRAPQMSGYPVSHTQKRLWVLSKLEEASVAYHIPIEYELTGKVNASVLRQALQWIVKRHESLRTVFREEGDSIRQIILSDTEAAFTFLQKDLSQLADQEVKNQVNSFRDKPFAMEKEPLFRVGLFYQGNNTTTLLMVMHHIISDGWSVRLMLQETLQVYEALTKGLVPELPELPLQYKDYAVWQQARINDPDTRRSGEFWHQQFDGELPVLELATDYPRPALKTFKGALTEQLIPPENVALFKKLCQQNHSTLFQGIYALLHTLLSRYTGQKDLVIGTPVANRTEAELQNIVGFFANTVPLRMQFDLQGGFTKLLTESQKTTQAAFEHSTYPFDQLIEELGLQRELSRSPLFDVMLVLHKESQEQAHEDAIWVEARETAQYSKFDLTFSFKETAKGLILKLEYNTDLFCKNRIRRMGQHIALLMEGITKQPETSLTEINFLTEEEEILLRQFSNQDSDLPKSQSTSLVEMFREQARKYPDKVAVYSSCDHSSLTYRQLDEQSDGLAAQLLHSQKTSSSELVGISGRRHHRSIVAMWAALKAGMAYIFLDPQLPESRRNYILRNAEVTTVLTDDKLDFNNWQVPNLIPIRQGIIKGKGQAMPAVAANELAYICYTSGSTGKPKGVMISQQNVIALAEGMQRIPQVKVTPEDRLVSVASFSFDMIVHDIFGCLLNGASLLLLDQEKDLDLEGLEQVYERYDVNRASLPTALFNTLVDLDFQGFHKLRLVITGGEAASVIHFRQFAKKYKAALYNGYGPAENTVYSSFFHFNSRQVNRNVPIGKPLDTVVASIRDENGKSVPLGNIGELWLSGEQLSQGYCNNEQLNTQKYLTDKTTNQRHYLSGDLCKWTEEGHIQYIGRKDDMLKIRGFLVEVQEIINVLLNHEAIREAMVLPRKEEADTFLVAYLVADTSDLIALKSYLRQFLPAYMLPRYFVMLDDMPINKSNKIDRQALQNMGLPSVEAESSQRPLTKKETLIVALWRELLKKEQLATSSNFYELGGDSIKAIQFISRLKAKDYKLTIKQFMSGPTVEEVAHKIVRIPQQENRTAPATATGHVALSPVIRHFFEKVDEPYLHHFNQSVKIFHPKGFDKEVIGKVLNSLLQHHDILRSCFRKNDKGQWEHFIRENIPPLEIQEINLIASPKKEEVFIREANALQASLNLEQGPLLKAGLFRDTNGDTLLLAIHHLVIDGVSWRILFEDLGILYQQITHGNLPQLPTKTEPFRQFVREQFEYIKSEAGQNDLHFWKRNTAQSLRTLPVEYPDQKNTVSEAHSISFSLSHKKTQQLQEVASCMDFLEVNHVMVAALGLALKASFGEGSYPVTMEGHGREELSDVTDLSRTSGWFTSIFPLILPSRNENAIIPYLSQVRDLLRQIPLRGACYGMFKYLTQEELPSPTSQISFNFLGHFDDSIETDSEGQMKIMMGEKGSEVHPLIERFHELELSGLISQGQLHFSVRYAQKRWNKTSIQTFAKQYQTHLETLLDILEEWKAEKLHELSFNQLNFYSGRRIVGDFSEIGPYRFDTFDKNTFMQALRWLQERHESLRSTVATYKGLPYLKIQPYEVPLKWDTYTGSVPIEDLIEQQRAEMQVFVSPSRPWEVSVIESEEGYILTMLLSHLFFDGYSQGILQAELNDFYQAALQNQKPTLAPPSSQYSDFVNAQRHYLESRKGRGGFNFWQQHLSDYSFRSLPPVNFCIRATTILDQDLTDEINRYLKIEGTSPAVYFLSALKQNLSDQDGNTLIALPVSLRSHELYDAIDNEQSIGFYTNILLHPYQAGETSLPFEQLLGHTQQQFARELVHGMYPYEHLLDQLQAPNDFHPVAGLNYHNYQYLSESKVSGVRNQIQTKEVTIQTRAKYWVDIFHFADGIQINATFHPKEVTIKEAERWVRGFSDILMSVSDRSPQSI
ncbi:amino acid adenylation domain-containing protein [Rapidithrix thailandica]|uniref:Amino acid adenylation domain-containing protein n=1 Tax=Rapidithrix thailandica TaxID=413964 RepID=A0AAW9S398_9BACT